MADLSAASALFQFFIDLVAVERSVSWFELERSPAEQAAFFERIERYFKDYGVGAAGWIRRDRGVPAGPAGGSGEEEKAEEGR